MTGMSAMAGSDFIRVSTWYPSRPGMIMSSVNLLSDNPNPSEKEIREGISGNFCRCTGYQHIVNAVQNAAGRR